MKSNRPTPNNLMRGKTPLFALKHLTVWLATAGFAANCLATVIVNDTWKDATRTDPAQPAYSENGTDADADGDIESAWYRSGTGSSTTMSTNHMVHTAGAAASMSLTTYFKTNGQAIALNSVGDSLKLTWVFKPNGMPTTNTGNADMRMALVATPAGARLTGDATPGATNYTGYAIFMNMQAGTLGNNSSFRLMRWNVASGALLSAAGSWVQVAVAPGVTNNVTPGYTEGNTYTLVWQITRTVGGADIYQGITDSGGTLGSNGVLQVSYSDATPQPLVFDTFALRPGTPEVTATNFDTTRFKVEFIPGGCAPTPFNVTGTTNVCPGNTAPVGLSGSQVNVDYHLLLGGSPVGSPVAGTGSALNFGLQGAGTYTVYASNTTIVCEGLLAGSAIIAEYADPVVTVNPSPAFATNTIGSTRVFSITASGPGLTYRWRKNGTALNNGGNISGATSNVLTLINLNLGDSGDYDCSVTNSPCGVTTTSSQANLAVVVGSGLFFRSINSGNWSDLAIWQQSVNGTTWTAASTTPSATDSNIVVQTSHVVVVDTEQTVDQLTIQSGATVSVQGGNFILNNGNGVDCNVQGKLEVGTGAGTISVGVASLQFASGGVFDWNRGATPAIPSATWQDGSTCRVSQVGTATDFASGVSGQNFYDFIYDTTTAGQSGVRTRLDIQGTATTVRRDFSITLPDTTNASVSINNSTGGQLTVGRHVTFTTGSSTNNNKVLLNNVAGNSYTFKVGGNFTATGFLDGFSSSSAQMEFNGSGTQTLTLPVEPFIVNASTMNWVVNSGSTVQLGNTLDGFLSFTNKGTFNFGNYTIVRGDTLVFAAGGTVIGKSTNQLTFTNGVVGVDLVQLGGNLNLPGLPAFAGGESFLLFEAAAHSGTFASITPATPGVGLTWNTSQLGTTGVLTVSSGAAPAATNITFVKLGGNQVVLNWPAGQGWKLQTQTNALSVGLKTNWVEVLGATPPYTNTISPANPAAFFRLVYP